MMSFKTNFVVFVTLCLRYQAMAEADPLVEMKLKYVKFVLECAAEHPVSPEELKEMGKNVMPKTDNSKCMLACSYRKAGMTHEDGKLSVEGIKKIASVAFADKPEMMKKSEEFIEACLPLNDEEISGEKPECERAARIFKCSVDHSSGISN